MPEESDHWDEPTLDAAANGRIRVFRGGQLVPYEMGPDDWPAFETAKTKGYCLEPTAQSVANCFAQWCKLNRRPHVKIRRLANVCEVTCDMLACESGLDVSAVDDLAQELPYVIRRWNNSFQKIDLLRIEHIALADGESVAARVVELAMNVRPESLDGNPPE